MSTADTVKPPNTHPRAAARLRPSVNLVVGFLVLCWLLAVLVIAADPYDLYRWGPEIHLPTNRPGDASEDLINVLAGDPEADVVIIGTSTAMQYSPESIRKSLRGARRPLNVSYSGSRPLDRFLVVNTFLQRSHAPRLLIWFDWSYALPPTTIKKGFPAYLYDATYLNDLRMVNAASIHLAFDILTHKPVFDELVDLEHQAEARRPVAYRRFQNVRKMQELDRLIALHRADILQEGRHSCNEFATLQSQAIPQFRALSRRGVQVDVVLPPYSLAMYYSWTFDGAAEARGGVALLNDQLLMRRCLVEATDDLPGVRVIALDKRFDITSDLANYSDPAHLYGEELHTRLLSGVDGEKLRVRKNDVDSYLERLRQAVASYHVVDSKLDLTGR